MKNKIKKWLGIDVLEKANKEKELDVDKFLHNYYLIEYNYVKNLVALQKKYNLPKDKELLLGITISNPFLKELNKMTGGEIL